MDSYLMPPLTTILMQATKVWGRREIRTGSRNEPRSHESQHWQSDHTSGAVVFYRKRNFKSKLGNTDGNREPRTYAPFPWPTCKAPA